MTTFVIHAQSNGLSLLRMGPDRSGAIQGLSDPLDSLGHRGFAGNFQAQLPGNVVDACRVEGKTTGINRCDQIPGALLKRGRFATREPGFEPMEGTFGKHFNANRLWVAFGKDQSVDHRLATATVLQYDFRIVGAGRMNFGLGRARRSRRKRCGFARA